MIHIFVFGSNEAGYHGLGSALEAKNNHVAILGKAFGLHGNSFAIPTKNAKLKPLKLHNIDNYVKAFIQFAIDNTQYMFNVCEIGCCWAGYKPSDIAPLFSNCINISNITLPDSFIQYIVATKV